MPGSYTLDLYRGDTWRMRFVFKAGDGTDLDRTGPTMQAQIRDRIDGPVRAEIELTLTPPNIVDAYLSAAVTSTFSVPGVWDLQFTKPNSDIQTVLAGPVKLKLDVTRPDAIVMRRGQSLRSVA